MNLPNITIARGDVWEIRFDPSEGDEIKKIRPAVVMTAQVLVKCGCKSSFQSQDGSRNLHIISGWFGFFPYQLMAWAKNHATDDSG